MYGPELPIFQKAWERPCRRKGGGSFRVVARGEMHRRNRKSIGSRVGRGLTGREGVLIRSLESRTVRGKGERGKSNKNRT